MIVPRTARMPVAHRPLAARTQHFRRFVRLRVPYAAWVLLMLALGCAPADTGRPDLALITTGPIAAERLACHGGGESFGTELCALGERGSRYVWAFAADTSTAPSVASIMTGRRPRDHGVAASAAGFLRGSETTLAERLSDVGYHTAAFVDAASVNRSRHFDQGFHRYIDPGSLTPDEDAVALATQWIARAPSPMFVWIHLGTGEQAFPHTGRSAADSNPEMGATNESLRRLDRRLSQLIAVLDAREQLPGILLTGTTGPSGGLQRAPAPASRAALDPIATRVPLLWRPARADGGRGIARVIRTPVGHLDILPTLLYAAGVETTSETFAGLALPFRDLTPDDESGLRIIDIAGDAGAARVGFGAYLVLDRFELPIGLARIPIEGERLPALGPPSADLAIAARLRPEAEPRTGPARAPAAAFGPAGLESPVDPTGATELPAPAVAPISDDNS